LGAFLAFGGNLYARGTSATESTVAAGAVAPAAQFNWPEVDSRPLTLALSTSATYGAKASSERSLSFNSS
jgi:hypothetical protein